MPRTSWPVGLLLLVCACRSDPAEAPVSDDDDGSSAASTGTGTTGAATALGDAAACERSNECEGDNVHCVAPYDAGLGQIGSAVCVASCVEAGDLARACIDDDSCCEGLQCNPVDGFCGAELVDETTSSTGTGGGTDTDTTSSSSGNGSSSSSSGGSSSSSSTSG